MDGRLVFPPRALDSNELEKLVPDFPYKTEPYAHQRDALRFLARRGKYAGLFMEQRTGKTKVILDEAAWRFLEDDIQALLIIAPSGVHTNWVRDEIPLHLSDAVDEIVIEWDTSKSKSKRFREEFYDALESGKLVILSMNIEAIITDGGKKACKTLMKNLRTMMVIDESTDIKTAGAKRTRSCKALGRLARFRRILSGFPAPEGPIDLYGQLSFLSPHIVGSNVAAFKARYAEFEQRYYHGAGAKPVPVIVGYRNLDELERITSEHCFRVRREDVFDLPDKIYQKRYFHLSPQQNTMYAEMETDWLTTYPDGAEVSAQLTIVRLLRLQQIASGYVPTDSGEDPMRRIDGSNPRLISMEDSIRKIDGQIIIWYRYRMDGDILMEALGDDAVRWDGATKKTREAGKRKFIDGGCRFFIGSPKAAGRGLTLRNAQASIYYSHYWSLEARIQSEDRSVGEKDWPPLYIDMLGRDTVDEQIIDALRAKDELSRIVIGDTARDWILWQRCMWFRSL